jgi:Gpi18-like mannosyltransferase
MLVWCGIAVSFKAQGLFLGPFVALRLVQDRTPLKYWAIPGFVYAGAMLPAALAGWPVADLASVYLRQAQWNPTLVSTAANPWSLAQYLAADSAYKWTWLGIAAAAGAGLGYIAAFRRRENSAADLVALALLSACLMPFLLPKMLERYFFLADVLAFALAILQRDRRSFAILGLVQGSSVLALAGVMLRAPLAPVIAMPMMLAAMLLLADRLRRGGALARCTAAEPG